MDRSFSRFPPCRITAVASSCLPHCCYLLVLFVAMQPTPLSSYLNDSPPSPPLRFQSQDEYGYCGLFQLGLVSTSLIQADHLHMVRPIVQVLNWSTQSTGVSVETSLRTMDATCEGDFEAHD